MVNRQRRPYFDDARRYQCPSAIIRIAVEPAVERWFDATAPESAWTTTITVFEIRFGLAFLAPGRRRDRLRDAFDIAIDNILGGRVLPFDRAAAETAAAFAAKQRQIGQPVEIRDVQIAGIAAARKASLVTRKPVISKSLASSR